MEYREKVDPLTRSDDQNRINVLQSNINPEYSYTYTWKKRKLKHKTKITSTQLKPLKLSPSDNGNTSGIGGLCSHFTLSRPLEKWRFKWSDSLSDGFSSHLNKTVLSKCNTLSHMTVFPSDFKHIPITAKVMWRFQRLLLYKQIEEKYSRYRLI